MTWFKTIMWGLMVFLAMVIGLYAFLFFLVPDLGDPAFKSHFSTIPMTARLHIIPGGIALVLGAFQFHPGLRKRWIKLHRYSGRFYVAWFSWIPNLVVAEWLFIQSPLRNAVPA